MTTPDSFDANLSKWKTYQEAPWGRLRYAIMEANLARHLPDGPLHILDIGGGNGADAIEYARQGHTVALLDCSAEMLADAERTARAHGVAERVTLHQADAGATAALFPAPVFDLVLLHFLIHYVDDGDGLLRDVSHPLRPGGLLSLATVNRYSESYRHALFGLDPAAAVEALDATSGVSSLFGHSFRLYDPDDLIPVLESTGYTLLARYGVRCVCDYMPNNEIKSDPDFYAQLLQLELAMSRRSPYRDLARFFHLVAQKKEAAFR